MANYTKLNAGTENRTELHDVPGLTGAEVSINRLPAGAGKAEIGEEAVNKLGPIAEKHGMYAIFHNHMQFATEGFSYDPFLAVSPAVMMNFDAGHFFGSTGIHPNTIIEKYKDRIFTIHIKDKTGPNTDPANTNQVWGQGEVPIADVLLLLKKNQKTFRIYLIFSIIKRNNCYHHGE